MNTSDLKLWIIVPCYNEEAVLPITAPLFLAELQKMIAAGKISSASRILFVNDGSKDATWDIIRDLSRSDEHFLGISQSRNRGHQNALLAGMMEAKERCDVTITIDCDGQDDISAMEQMIDEYRGGSDIVYGVRSSRETDTWFKRTTARSFYKLMNKMGVEMIYDHADYRLVSAKVLRHFSEFREVNLFLRGMFPLVGFKSTCVYYKRSERLAGKSHYPLGKMISFAIDGITSLSIKPLTLIVVLGLITCLLGFVGIIWAIAEVILKNAIAGWASTVCIILFLGGVQLLSIGVIGEYIGKIYLETKQRPRYIISEKTWEE
ncbi:MAG: glycosyltransferase family 2 protein [Oscillospiraceae bacterium]|nr:glycosyltransferase family 2 protein [Oscillospiraceae bacterium]